MNPVVSVIIPVFNSEKYLLKTINSILNQTFSNLELIIIDDGSTDNSVNIINSFKDNRIRLIKNERNLGISYSRNRGLLESQGDYIAMCDSDDISLNTRIEEQIKIMKNDSSIDFCYTAYLTINEQDKYISYPFSNILKSDIRWQLFWDNPICQSTVMFKRQLFVNNTIKYNQDLIIAEDLKLWQTVASMCKFYCLYKPLVLYRVHSESIYQTNRLFALREASQLSFNYLSSYNGSDIPDFYSSITLFSHNPNHNTDIDNAVKVQEWLIHLMNKFFEFVEISKDEIVYIKEDVKIRFALYFRHIHKLKLLKFILSISISLNFNLINNLIHSLCVLIKLLLKKEFFSFYYRVKFIFFYKLQIK